MGGFGKTTLSQLAYNAEVKSHFQKGIWVCVSDPFEEERISLEILESILDDVWAEDSSKWKQLKASLKSSSPGSRVLVTSRKKEVGMAMGTFFERTREERQNLEGIGRKIVERCKGLPLAVKTLGGLLRFRETKQQWQSILDNTMWEIEEVEKGVFPLLSLSYYDLTPNLRRCFSYCAIFPKDYEIEKEKLMKLWMAQSFIKEKGNKEMEIIGEEYFNTLAMRSFFQDFEKDKNNDIIRFKMHDIVHDFAQFLTEEECLLIESDGVKEPWKDPSFKNIHHSMMLILKGGDPIPMENWKKLRTLCCIQKNEAVVVEAYQPPPNLETLEILFLGGPTLCPSWMMSLNLLKSVELRTCAHWESLPPMGKLPSLEYLLIFNMGKVKKVGEEFLGIEREDLGQTSSSSSVSNNNIVAFPDLKTPKFIFLSNWEEWEYENIWGGEGQEECSCITIDIMPRLQSLLIENCPKLKGLPHHLLHNIPTIQELVILLCPILKKRFEKGRGEDWPYISRIPNIRI
ncbi:hypothetical protein PTKIN_Ptkin14bG0052800 [Pterospermum kingtungense]